MDGLLALRFILFFILLFLSAFFSGAEIALFSLSPAQVDILREKNGKAGRLVAGLLSARRRLLVTIYMGNELINVAIAAVSTVIALHYFKDYGVAIAIGAGTFMLLLFGDIIPKTFALKHAEKFSLFAAPPLSLFAKIINPIVEAVTWMVNKMVKTGAISQPKDRSQMTEDEFESLLEQGEHKGVIESEEKEMILNVFELGDTPVSEIMTPRTEIFALLQDEGLEGVIERAVLSNYSRIPVYRKDVDHIQGILYTKDLLDPGIDMETAKVEDFLRDAYFIPATKKIDELLREFRKKRTHLAVVLDEYGGVEGLVTLEDILEEVMGEPADQKATEEILSIGGGVFNVPGRMSLDDFNEQFSRSLEVDETHTIGGFVFDLFGRVPRWGESVMHDDITFTVSKLKRQMIWQLHVKLDEKIMRKEKNGNTLKEKDK